ncbi:hypothetical protein LAZ67_3006245 [Cordylochernes scorpioides]|uniref:Uncharacterized protein n=1 Tax=Cordylochernes scorpioides TaxID=51811 RepID=A0ABY6KB88_9ARAC|nr:hypothetical protein LAZ67_3006245 [Cordylochernes scorpioides]
MLGLPGSCPADPELPGGAELGKFKSISLLARGSKRSRTGDETRCFLFYPQTKKQSLECHTLSSPRKNKVRLDKSKGKVMLVVFFDYQELVYYEFIKEGLLLINRYTKKYLCAFVMR